MALYIPILKRKNLKSQNAVLSKAQPKSEDYLSDKPLVCEEFAGLNLPNASILRLRCLIEQEKKGQLTYIERAQLEAFREAAFYIRMGDRADK